VSRVRASARAGGTAAGVTVDASELLQLIKDAQVADKRIYSRLRKALKESADEAVGAAKAEVQGPPPAKVGSIKRGVKVTRRKNGSLRTQVVIAGYNARTDATRSRSTGLRRNIAGTIGASIPTAKSKAAQITIRANANKMPSGQKSMVKAYNSGKLFRHPVFADQSKTRDQWKWAYQGGRPYFGSVILANRKQMLNKIEATMRKYLAELGD